MVVALKRLNVLYEKVIKSDSADLATVDTGYFSNGTQDSVVEFADWFLKYVKKFGIAMKISRKYWGDRKRKLLQNVLYDTVKKQKDDRIGLVKSPTRVYDDLRQDVRSKSHTKSDFARVARTETANIKAVYQLQSWQKAGVKRVIHKNNPGSVARKTVSPKCKLLNNRVFEIDYLLSKAGENDRICIHPNCMCRYQIKL